jgi:protein-L-isoaspartate(D-aspartate) O-methyltransferase
MDTGRRARAETACLFEVAAARVDTRPPPTYFWAWRPAMTSTQPLLFTVAFRRKMAELPQRDRQEWLASLATRLRSVHATEGARVLWQEVREVARGCRLPLVDSIDRQLGPFDARHLAALLEVPRERFVRVDDVERSPEDTPLPLDDEGLSTISAPHAYLLSYRLLDLGPGDALVELGTGSGYGAALAAFITGPDGRTVTIEIDEILVRWAERTLSSEPNVRVVHGDAMTSAPQWGSAKKIVVTFAVEGLPPAWIDALPEGGKIVAPVGSREGDQTLVLAERKRGRVLESEHGAVRYVKNRSTG